LTHFQEEIFGTSYLAAAYLKHIGYSGTVYVVGSTGIAQELDEMGIKHVGIEVRYRNLRESLID